ncbi:MAG: hybrid sensor histidine kinase/response regulator [Brachymonas sp.]
MQSDLTQRFRNESLVSQLQVEKHKAEAASEAKSRFLAAASHDLRQPVHAVALLASALQDQSSDSGQRDLLSRLQGGVAHFADVVDEVLDVARLDAGAVPVNWQAVRVQDLLDRVDSTYRALAQAKGLALLIRPCGEGGAAVRADAALLWRVLSNLVSNAVRYTEQGTVLVAVRRAHVSGQPSQLAWRFEVRDSGPGIAAEQQRLIFEEFYQLHNPQRDAKSGLGLGLAVAQRMAQLMNSQVRVISQLKRGATFSIALCTDFMPAEASKSIKNAARNTPLAHLRVLVVDDDAASREAMGALLASWGLSAQLASNTAEAVQAVQGLIKLPQDRTVLLTDHWLAGGEDAFSVAQAVQHAAGGQTVHVAVFTGDIRPELREQVQSQGWFFAPKPVRALALRLWLESLPMQEVSA